MIRLDVDAAKLRAAIDQVSATWRVRAGAATTSASRSDLWTEIRAVFRSVQADKCAYCEKQTDDSGIENPVEHFRPKSRVTPWPRKVDIDALPNLSTLSVGAGRADGYGWLAFVPWNYVTGCATCNSTLKADCFPIRAIAADPPDAAVLAAISSDVCGAAAQAEIKRLMQFEQQLLIFPLGSLDENPEEVIRWFGPLPRAIKSRASARHLRAVVSISFFRLDGDGGRQNMVLARAVRLLSLFRHLQKAKSGNSKAKKAVKTMQKSDQPFAACSRAFVKLFRSNLASAKKIYRVCEQYVETDPDLRELLKAVQSA